MIALVKDDHYFSSLSMMTNQCYNKRPYTCISEHFHKYIYELRGKPALPK